MKGYFCYAGVQLELPNADELRSAGIQQFGSSCDAAGGLTGADCSLSLSRAADAMEMESSVDTAQPMICLGSGLPALSKKMVAKRLASEYVDFSELPPAKGKGRAMPQSLEGQVIVVQAADLLQAGRIIPDLATWLQCFAVYVATLSTKYPKRVPDLMAYQTTIVMASQKYRWPSWVVYDQNFRQEAAGNPLQSWAKVDPSIYAQCFTGQAVSAENWCAKCQYLDHTSVNCPYRQRKSPWHSMAGAGASQPMSRNEQQICMKFNKFNGDCKFGKDCRYLHVCSVCRENHPVSRCKSSGGNGVSAPAMSQ